ncbi:MAG: hypothetical protein ACR2O0_14415 [Rhizobiaceae bacterium]
MLADNRADNANAAKGGEDRFHGRHIAVNRNCVKANTLPNP